jgi:hypothetical protein
VTPRSALPTVVALALLAVSGPVLAACGGDSDDATDVTLPSSLGISTTVPGPTTSSSTTSTTSGVPPTDPAPDGAPVLLSVRAAPGACANGTTSATVTFDAASTPPVRVFTVFLDGADAGASNTTLPITVPNVPCDGNVHSVLLIATGTDGSSATQSVAFRAPRP